MVGNATTGRQRLSELGDNIQLKRHPYPPYNDDKFVLVIQQQFPLILILSFVLVALNVVKDVVHEKERKLKVYELICHYSNAHCGFIIDSPFMLKKFGNPFQVENEKQNLKKMLFSLHFLFSLFCKMQHLQQLASQALLGMA